MCVERGDERERDGKREMGKGRKEVEGILGEGERKRRGVWG